MIYMIYHYKMFNFWIQQFKQGCGFNLPKVCGFWSQLAVCRFSRFITLVEGTVG